MSATEHALLESWDRQARIVANVAEAVDASALELTPAEGETDIAFHLNHVHSTRRFWLMRFAPERPMSSERLFIQTGDDAWEPCRDLARIREQLALSALDVREAVREGLADPAWTNDAYSHPVMFLQHMVWHEGWHVGLILLAFRRNGRELPEAWEEPNVWGVWRTE